MSQSIKSPSSYMDYLPAAYRQVEEDGAANLLGSFLKIFEKILTGIDDHVQVDIKLPDGSVEKREVIGVEQIVDVTHDYFDPLFAPLTAEEEPDKADFVQYLASWVALTLNQNWPENRKRRVLQKIVALYKRRGTKEGLQEYLEIFVGPNVDIEESLAGIQIGELSTVGVDTVIGGAPPFFFYVRISLNAAKG